MKQLSEQQQQQLDFLKSVHDQLTDLQGKALKQAPECHSTNIGLFSALGDVEEDMARIEFPDEENPYKQIEAKDQKRREELQAFSVDQLVWQHALLRQKTKSLLSAHDFEAAATTRGEQKLIEAVLLEKVLFSK